jgi:hypothetical protein
MQAIALAERSGAAGIEPTVAAERAWNETVQRRMEGTVWTAGGCESWYIDSKGRNTTLWPDFSFRFRRELAHLEPAEYRLLAKPVADPVPGTLERGGALLQARAE